MPNNVAGGGEPFLGVVGKSLQKQIDEDLDSVFACQLSLAGNPQFGKTAA